MADSRYETEEFRILRPATPGGDYQVQAKDDDRIVALLRYDAHNAITRRWRVRIVGEPDRLPWRCGVSMMDVARYGYCYRKTGECST